MLERLFIRTLKVQRNFRYRKVVRTGVVFSEKFNFNRNTGHFEIMRLNMVHSYIDSTCSYLVFTVFDYVTCTHTI